MSPDPADVDRADYLAWSRVWEAVGHLAPMRPIRIEHRLGAFFRRLVARLEPTHVLEIGAHEAAFSRWVAEHLPHTRVTAFEANPFVHEEYAAELAATRVDYRNLAVGPVTGEVELLLPRTVGRTRRRRNSKMGSLHPHTRGKDVERVTVPSVRLVDHVGPDDPDRRLACWIDVEGATNLVLEGAGPVLDRVEALMIEVENRTNWEGQWLDVDVAACLRRHGLVPLVRDITPRSHQYNVVFVRAGLLDDAELVRDAARVMRRPGPDPRGEKGPRASS